MSYFGQTGLGEAARGERIEKWGRRAVEHKPKLWPEGTVGSCCCAAPQRLKIGHTHSQGLVNRPAKTRYTILELFDLCRDPPCCATCILDSTSLVFVILLSRLLN